MLSDKEILIDELDMNFVQTLITAVDDYVCQDEEYKEAMRKRLDRWQNALTLSDKIRVTF